MKRKTIIIDDLHNRDLNNGKFGTIHSHKYGGNHREMYGDDRMGIELTTGLGLYEALGKASKLKVTITVVE